MSTLPAYQPAADRYDVRAAAGGYRRCGRSGLQLPPLSLGLWHNFGATKAFETQRATLRRAFDLGLTHIDLANNYGPPYGAAEESFGRVLAADLHPYRDELVISTKAGYDMWPGPYGDGGSRKYLLRSLEQSLTRMGTDHVDIFYSHRPDPETPLEETVGALLSAVHQGKALYVGISNYPASLTRRVAQMLAAEGVRLLVHQPRYSMLDRAVERVASGEQETLLDAVDELGVGVAVFSPLAQGLLTERYLDGVPGDSRAAVGHFLTSDRITPGYLAMVRGLREVAAERGQSVAQLALSWVLRDRRVTTAIIGASSVAQLEDNVAALSAPPLGEQELARIESLLAG